MSHAERKIPQKTDGSISNAPFRMPQQPYDNWNTTELSVKETHQKENNNTYWLVQTADQAEDLRKIWSNCTIDLLQGTLSDQD